jgi:hypothetical protein
MPEISRLISPLCITNLILDTVRSLVTSVDEVTRNCSVTIFVATDVSFVFIGSEVKVWDMILGKRLTTAVPVLFQL